jgi:4-hydroxy-tetrahydrodipicolinate synthase
MTHDLTQFCLDGNFAAATELQLKYLRFINALFCEVNPVPVKTAMAELGKCDVEMRLPLCEMDDANKAKLLGTMKDLGLL